MRLAFAGTPEFAAIALAALLQDGQRVELVLTKSDRPQGRGLRSLAGPVKQLARARGIAVEEPESLKDAGVQASLRLREIDLLVVAAYGLLLPPAMLGWPRHGCLNIHASLLPRWRGAAPIQRALLAGDAETGISIMQMDAGLDTGPVVAAHAVSIGAHETGGSLHDTLASVGARAVVAAVRDLDRTGSLAARPQPETGVTYAPKITRGEAGIDWRESAVAIARRIRAFDPVPGAYTTLDGVVVKLWQAEAAPGRMGTPGTVAVADGRGIVVACGDGIVVVQALQRAGGRRLPAASFIAGHPLRPGQILGQAPLQSAPATR